MTGSANTQHAAANTLRRVLLFALSNLHRPLFYYIDHKNYQRNQKSENRHANA